MMSQWIRATTRFKIWFLAGTLFLTTGTLSFKECTRKFLFEFRVKNLVLYLYFIMRYNVCHC